MDTTKRGVRGWREAQRQGKLVYNFIMSPHFCKKTKYLKCWKSLIVVEVQSLKTALKFGTNSCNIVFAWRKWLIAYFWNNWCCNFCHYPSIENEETAKFKPPTPHPQFRVNYGTKFLFLLGCPFCWFRYNYEDVPNSWIHEGSDAASAPCFPASTSEINEMIFNTPPLSTKNFTAFANSSITFRVRRPLEKQLHHEEILVIRSLKLQKTWPLILNAFLYFPTANPTTPITCIEFFGKPSGFLNEFSPNLPDSKMEWQLALGYKLQSLGMDQFSHVVVTLVQPGLPQIIQLKNAQIVYFDEWKDYLGSWMNHVAYNNVRFQYINKLHVT